MNIPRAQVLHESLVGIANGLPYTHLPTLTVSMVSLLMLFLLPKWQRTKKVPAPLLVVTFMIIVFAAWMLSTHDSGAVTDAETGAVKFLTDMGIALVGYIPSDFPTPRMPQLTMQRAVGLLSTAVSVTFVGFIER